MYSWGKSLREEKPRKHPKSPSFSSNLLDEIMRSIDGDEEKYEEDYKFYKENSTIKQNSSNGGARAKANSIEDEEMASLKRASLMEKLMEKKINDRVSSRRRPSSLPKMESRSLQDNDHMFFSTSSSSSGSSSGGLSLSDAEFFGSAKSKTSCFAPPRPKPKKANVPPQPGGYQNPLYYEQSEYFMFDDYQSQQRSKTEENLIKSKSRALNIYSNLKKMKQPISPGFRLTSFINSLFTSGNGKKSKNVSINGGLDDATIERQSKSTNASTCSSASSFSRSCLSKSAPDSRGKFTNGVKRTVRFYPVSVIVDEDSRPCGHKSIYDEDFETFRRPHSSQSSAAVKSHLVEKNRKTEEGARDVNKGYQDQKKDNFIMERLVPRNVGNYEDDDDDAASDSSSDLFEIDHLSFFGNDGCCEELPVYETTHLDRNRAIARGLIC